MKAPLLSLLALASLAHATPPVLPLTQAAVQKVDPDIKPDHYDIARTDLNADGKEDVLALMNGKSGYRDGDEFAVVEGIPGRRFPVDPDDQSGSEPTGKMRQMQLKLHAGEAGWQLQADKVVEI